MANQRGLDWDYAGAMIAWAMECFEKGLLAEKDTDGLELKFGNFARAVLKLIEKIAKKEGFGDIPAHGVKVAITKVGEGSGKYLDRIKGNPLLAELRIDYQWALAHGISNIGPHHLRGAAQFFDPHRVWGEDVTKRLFGSIDALRPETIVGKGKVTRYFEHCTPISDCVGVCKFASSPYASLGLITVEDTAELLSSTDFCLFS
jgi:aldehyde:ferredoxin oxidoreductase